jgi:hypothetical protein
MKIDLRETGCERARWTQLSEDRIQQQVSESVVIVCGVSYGGVFPVWIDIKQVEESPIPSNRYHGVTTFRTAQYYPATF